MEPVNRPGELLVDLSGPWSMAWVQGGPVPEYPFIADLERSGMALISCTVPGNFELELVRLRILPDPYAGLNILKLRHFEHVHVWYYRRFEFSDVSAMTADLVFEGLDCLAEVFFNGKHLGSADNMLVEQVFSIKGILEAENEIVVHLRPAVDEAKKFPYPPGVAAFSWNRDGLYLRKAPHMTGWDIMPRVVSAGVWRPVGIRLRPLEHIIQAFLSTLSLTPDHSRAALSLRYELSADIAQGGYALAIEGKCGRSSFQQTWPIVDPSGVLSMELQDPQLWWPKDAGAQSLYEVTVTLLKEKTLVDFRPLLFGVRTVELVKSSVITEDGQGDFRFIINGEPIFIRGVNWVPCDAFHGRDNDRRLDIMELLEDIGCNLVRCWGGNVYEPDEFFELCDQMGVMVWQDFAMACALYPQDADFQRRLGGEARSVVRRLRQHPSLVLWAGDNECDQAPEWFQSTADPNGNVLTRQVLPSIVAEEDGSCPYLPSSPYIDPEAHRQGGMAVLPENHLWGPRDYFKSPYYMNARCRFVSEIGYQGCVEPDSLREFLSPDKVWPPWNNDEWALHSTSPVPPFNDQRVQLVRKHIEYVFGKAPDDLEHFWQASQAAQAEAYKFFIELFRSTKWRRTGIIWWNLMDGWPQISDAVVDYYFRKKMAFGYIRNSQQALCLMMREPEHGKLELAAVNDRLVPDAVSFVLKEAESGRVLAQGKADVPANGIAVLAKIPYLTGEQHLYLMEWEGKQGKGRNHYLAGDPPFDLEQYLEWQKKYVV